jgi:predicted nucleotidyltransferase
VPVNTTIPSDIESSLSTLGAAIARECPDVEFVYLFGSRSTGNATPRSDVDLAIYVASSADQPGLRLDAARVSAAHLGTDAIDMVLLNAAPIALAGRVLVSRRVLLDRNPFLRHRYESSTARLFQDFRIREHRILAQRYPRG